MNTGLRRESVPVSFRNTSELAPLRFSTPDPASIFLADFASYQASCAEFMEASKQHVHENPDASEVEYMIHCGWLANQIQLGVRLMLYAKTAGLTSFAEQIQLIQGQVDDFISTMHMWHGAVRDQNDLPGSLLKAFADDEARRVTEMTDSHFADGKV